VTVRIEIDPALVEERIMTLSAIGACAETGVCRRTYSPEWVAAQELVRDWIDAAGLTARYDAVGNLWGRLEGSDGGKAVVSGSHIDSQIPGGRYDGALGIIAALTAIESLQAQFGQPKRPLEVISFCEEEGSAFSGARFWGSRAITGRISPEDPDGMIGHDGITMSDKMRSLGYDPARIPDAMRTDIEAFIELHIEQGPILEQQEIPVGIVNVINGSQGALVEVVGESNHAGARPMDMRRDPLVGAAEMVLAVNRNAVSMGRPAVSTVGRMLVEPNGSAIIPKKVTFSIDARHNDVEALRILNEAHERAVHEIAERNGLVVNWSFRPHLPPCVSDPDIVSLLEEAAKEQGISALTMPSGALHDTQRMSEVARVAMIFVQSLDGRSHTPEEFSSIEHCIEGIRLLAAGLHKLAY